MSTDVTPTAQRAATATPRPPSGAGSTSVPSTPNRPAGLNRSLLTLIGLLLVLAGLAVGVLGLGLLANRTPVAVPSPGDPLLPQNLSLASWVPYVVIVVAVLVGLGCLRWLVAQTNRRPVAQTWRLPTEAGQGRTEVDSDVAAAAFVAEVETYPGVARAAAYITGSHAQPAVHLTLTTTDQAPVDELRERIDTIALPRLREALELDSVAAEVLIRLGTRQPANRLR